MIPAVRAGFAAFLILLWGSLALAQTPTRFARGETVYVPVYSHVYSGDRALPFNLAATLSIRNVDPAQAISVTAIDYYDDKGKLLKKHLRQPLRLGPLASHEVYLKESDTSGGFGANFIVRWEAAGEVNAPLIESVMIGTRSGQGISFVGRGQVLGEPRR